MNTRLLHVVSIRLMLKNISLLYSVKAPEKTEN